MASVNRVHGPRSIPAGFRVSSLDTPFIVARALLFTPRVFHASSLGNNGAETESDNDHFVRKFSPETGNFVELVTKIFNFFSRYFLI